MEYDRLKEVRAFDESKSGVKGLVDSGIVAIPKIFIRPADELAEDFHVHPHLKVPVVDMSEIQNINRRKEIVSEIKHASEKWGFFQVVNHGVPLSSLNNMIDGIRMFHEQDDELKREWYSRDRMKRVRFDSNVDLYQSRSANWRDTLTISIQGSDHLDLVELPQVCRDSTIEYINKVTKLGETLFELLSEALELKMDHLNSIECASGRVFVCHYYPPCPEPELTLGTSKHSDPTFLTILLQDSIGGLQVMQQNQWVNVQPTQGALVVNIGDLLQIISNDKFRSVYHRVLANSVGPRISTACFFNGVMPAKSYGPIKELLSRESPPLYNEFTVGEYFDKFFSRSLDDKTGLELFKIR